MRNNAKQCETHICDFYKDSEPMDNLDFKRKPRSLRTKNMDVSRQQWWPESKETADSEPTNHPIPTVSMATDGTRG